MAIESTPTQPGMLYYELGEMCLGLSDEGLHINGQRYSFQQAHALLLFFRHCPGVAHYINRGVLSELHTEHCAMEASEAAFHNDQPLSSGD